MISSASSSGRIRSVESFIHGVINVSNLNIANGLYYIWLKLMR